MEKKFYEYKKEFGSVTTRKAYENGNFPHVMELALKQAPYLDGFADEPPVFRASAVDEEGNEYEVEWEVKDNWEEIAKHSDDQEMVENWEEPDVITEI